jgi:hypothetical protein
VVDIKAGFAFRGYFFSNFKKTRGKEGEGGYRGKRIEK